METIYKHAYIVVGTMETITYLVPSSMTSTWKMEIEKYSGVAKQQEKNKWLNYIGIVGQWRDIQIMTKRDKMKEMTLKKTIDIVVMTNVWHFFAEYLFIYLLKKS
jgi:hypothetical protein